MTVLVVSSLKDVHTRAVMTALMARANSAVELLDHSEFPHRLVLSLGFENGRRRFTLRRDGGGILDFASVRAVWWRRPQPFSLPVALADPLHRRFAVSEGTTAFDGLYQSMDAFWVNKPSCDAAAAHKPWQLALAQELRLDLPVTVMTNDPDEARAFWDARNGQVIYKQFRAVDSVWRETRLLRQNEAALAESVRLAPVIFQEYIDAVADIRVIIVGNALFAAAADTRNADYPVDVRMNLNLDYKPYLLPSGVSDRLHGLMRRLGLEYGAIDLRLTPDGRHVFLEINPAGQFLYIEQATGQHIAAALAGHLTGGCHWVSSK